MFTERVAHSIFECNMQKVTKTFTIFDAGVNPETLEQASADPTLYLQKIGDNFYLKRGRLL